MNPNNFQLGKCNPFSSPESPRRHLQGDHAHHRPPSAIRILVLSTCLKGLLPYPGWGNFKQSKLQIFPCPLQALTVGWSQTLPTYFH